MKKNMACILCLLFLNSLEGQPVLANWFNYKPGDSFKFNKVLNLDQIPTIETVGNNITWDLSSMILEDTVRKNVIINCSESDFPDYFPGCSYVLK